MIISCSRWLQVGVTVQSFNEVKQFHFSHNENAVILIFESDLALPVISYVLVTSEAAGRSL